MLSRQPQEEASDSIVINLGRATDFANLSLN
jgi:hypothetical protein